jgi:hypothetical protein
MSSSHRKQFSGGTLPQNMKDILEPSTNVREWKANPSHPLTTSLLRKHANWSAKLNFSGKMIGARAELSSRL